MSNEARRTLVVDLDLLESSRDLFREMAKAEDLSPMVVYALEEQASLVDRTIKQGTTVRMDPEKVAGFAQALANCSLVREADWEARERQQFYSEADSADADWSPAGETA